jgi:hypothetical protein
MRFFSTKEDDDNAYRTPLDAGRAIRRGTDKAINVMLLGLPSLLSGNDDPTDLAPDLATDAAKELVTKVIPRSFEDREEDND